MKCLVTGLAAVLVIFLGAAQKAVADDKADPADEKALQRLNEAFVAAFNKGDIKTMAASYASDADFRSAEGKMVKGRAEIEEYFAKGFAENKGLKLKHSHSSLRFLTPDVAIDEGIWEITGRPDGKASKGCYTAILIKRDGKWLIVCDRPILGNIGVIVLPDQVAVAKAHEAFKPDGSLTDPKQQAGIEGLGTTNMVQHRAV